MRTKDEKTEVRASSDDEAKKRTPADRRPLEERLRATDELLRLWHEAEEPEAS